MNKKIIITIITITLLTLVILFTLFIFNGREHLTIEDFSKKFIKEFATYQLSDTNEYNNRIIKYIDRSYKDDFEALFFLQKQKFVTYEKTGNYSQYLSSDIEIQEISANEYDVTISHSSKRKNLPAKDDEFTENNRINIKVIKRGDDFFITNLVFLTPGQ